MITDETARAVIAADMKARDINPYGLKSKVDVPTSTLYQYFSEKRNVRLAVEVTSKILAAIGRDFSWLQRECVKMDAAMKKGNWTFNGKGKPKPVKVKPSKPPSLIARKRAANKKHAKKR